MIMDRGNFIYSCSLRPSHFLKHTLFVFRVVLLTVLVLFCDLCFSLAWSRLVWFEFASFLAYFCVCARRQVEMFMSIFHMLQSDRGKRAGGNLTFTEFEQLFDLPHIRSFFQADREDWSDWVIFGWCGKEATTLQLKLARKEYVLESFFGLVFSLETSQQPVLDAQCASDWVSHACRHLMLIPKMLGLSSSLWTLQDGDLNEVRAEIQKEKHQTDRL